jgi:hypothetical protein
MIVGFYDVSAFWNVRRAPRGEGSPSYSSPKGNPRNPIPAMFYSWFIRKNLIGSPTALS